MVGGSALIEYKIDSGSWVTGTSFSLPAYANHSNDGLHTVSYRSTDAAGNTETAKSVIVRIDTTGPTVGSSVPAGWSKAAVTVTLSPVDGGSGVAKTQYRAKGAGTWLDKSAKRFVVAAPTNHSNDGTHDYEYRAIDNAGNVSATGACLVQIDTTGPSTSGKSLSFKAAKGKKGRAVSLKYRITDNLSSSATAVTLTIKDAKGKLVKKFALGTKVTNKWLTVKWTSKAKGIYKYSVSAKDLAGNKQIKAPGARITVN
jgi:hypothetical protein